MRPMVPAMAQKSEQEQVVEQAGEAAAAPAPEGRQQPQSSYDAADFGGYEAGRPKGKKMHAREGHISTDGHPSGPCWEHPHDMGAGAPSLVSERADPMLRGPNDLCPAALQPACHACHLAS